jgi:uncharacterized membrane protein YedE/YeeE
MAAASNPLNEFTPVTAAIGGMLLGLSSTVLLHQTGRWSGASSIYRGATEKPLGSWQQTWIAGCMGAVALARLTQAPWLTQYLGANAVDSPLGEVILASVLIGAGTRLANGCTSGHGVMGVPRFSLRSIVATGTFMATGVLAASFLRPLLFTEAAPGAGASALLPNELAVVGNVAIAAASAYSLALDLKQHFQAAALTFACGLTFGLGLLVSGMVEAEKITGFLDIRPLFDASSLRRWDPSMIVVMCSALLTNALTFNLWLIPKGTKHHEGQPAAIEGFKYTLPTATKITSALVVGSALFGVGWGLSGICVGPAVANAAKGGVTSLIVLASISLGSHLSKFADSMFGL